VLVDGCVHCQWRRRREADGLSYQLCGCQRDVRSCYRFCTLIGHKSAGWKPALRLTDCQRSELRWSKSDFSINAKCERRPAFRPALRVLTARKSAFGLAYRWRMIVKKDTHCCRATRASHS
jgi:hypothetical protein